MPVLLRSAAVPGIVGVQQPEAAWRHRRQFGQRGWHAGRGGQVVPGREQVTGVQAELRARVPVERGEVRSDVGDGRAQRGALPRRGLDQQVRTRTLVTRQRVEQGQQRLPCPAQPSLAVSGDRGAGVHDHAACTERSAAPQAVREQLCRPVPQGLIR
jgi:hypothetical protein